MPIGSDRLERRTTQIERRGAGKAIKLAPVLRIAICIDVARPRRRPSAEPNTRKLDIWIILTEIVKAIGLIALTIEIGRKVKREVAGGFDPNDGACAALVRIVDEIGRANV